MRIRLIECAAIVIGVAAVCITLPLLPIIWLWVVIAESLDGKSENNETKQTNENK